MDQLDFP